jgi:hypothetical protein
MSDIFHDMKGPTFYASNIILFLGCFGIPTQHACTTRTNMCSKHLTCVVCTLCVGAGHFCSCSGLHHEFRASPCHLRVHGQLSQHYVSICLAELLYLHSYIIYSSVTGTLSENLNLNVSICTYFPSMRNWLCIKQGSWIKVHISLHEHILILGKFVHTRPVGWWPHHCHVPIERHNGLQRQQQSAS